MEEGRVLRSKGKSRSEKANNTTTARTTETTTTTNTIPSLMSLTFPQIPETSQQAKTQLALSQQIAAQETSPPHNTSSSDTDRTIISPQYNSIAAQGIRQQFKDLRLSQRVEDENETVVNNDGLTLREYVSASVGASQAEVMNQVKESLRQLVPQIVREVMRTERNNYFETMDHTPIQRPTRGNDNHHMRQHDIPNQRYEEQFQIPTLTSYFRRGQLQPSDMEKWGIKFDGNRKSFTVEDFVFRVESLQLDYNCPATTLMKGFHHLLSGTAYEWFWTFRRENLYCEWPHLKYSLIRKFRRFENDTDIQRCIMERRQGSLESSEAFIAEIITLKNQLTRVIREEELVKIVKDNLKDGVYQLIYPINIRTFDHLLDECRRAERNLAKRSNTRQSSMRRISEIDCSPIDDEFKLEIDALKKYTPSKTASLLEL